MNNTSNCSTPPQAARHVCQEARTVLTSLRNGPPHVARGDLAQDLMELRDRIQLSMDNNTTTSTTESDENDDCAQPFLQVVMDPRASGPHTLVALRAILRLLQRGSFMYYQVPLEALTQAILACKFEQTDAGADEAVEMAIADVLSLLVQLDTGKKNAIQPTTLMEAFNTVFVTRNTFVHSPALCYHFEDVLTTMVEAVLQRKSTAARLIVEFLVNQLLHTPLVGGDGLDESTREAQMAHNATRVSCLRLTRTALRTGWGNDDSIQQQDDEKETSERTLLQIIQDDLCLSLLMTGQAIWSYHDASMDISPGFVSLEVLSEICATLSTLWNTLPLRVHLIAQFETIFTGFYTRALVLLRKRKQPGSSLAFNANLIFDSEVEIILESLVDILCLHDHRRSIADGDGGSLETMFAYYDCHLRRSDVAVGLMVELCRCCGGTVNEEGDGVLTPSSSGVFRQSSSSDNLSTASTTEGSTGESPMVRVDHPWRQVPAHLKELCAQALMGGMKCLFRDDKPSAETMVERSRRKKTIMLRQVDGMDDEPVSNSNHLLRDVKSKKRLMRRAARVFNQKASRGIEFLVDAGLVPDPVTPASVATFLRNGIVVGLDKKAVGAYLGEAGKAPVAGKSPPSWERDWFHKDVLKIYCSLFRFEQQRLLDGLRMFLASFRLPGEAQQIDRILQAFADSCGQVCEESARGRLKLFSDDPKRASDAAYLLSFSIIMLNTDRHNDNIREDRKMSCDDFVKNNTDYGRDITEKGKELPRDYLGGIYESINEEEIRTEGEGADGAMTIERWKDVLRGSTEDVPEDEVVPSAHDAEDLTELILEHVWKPIMSVIGAFWNVTRSEESEYYTHASPSESAHSSMLGVQGARLGMDIALEMLYGVRLLGRVDIFRKIFTWVCDYTGLLGDYETDAVERTWELTNSIEAQSAVVVAVRTALECGEDLDEVSWKRVCCLLFELRDLKLIFHGKTGKSSILHESDPDFLNVDARRDWTMCLIKGDMDYSARAGRKGQKKKTGFVLGAFGRALFGSDDGTFADEGPTDFNAATLTEKSAHGKEDLVVWDEYAPSDDEDDAEDECQDDSKDNVSESGVDFLSAGAAFENQMMRENLEMNREMDMPITGLERAEETRPYQISPRARVRSRFRHSCNLKSLVWDSRFLDDDGICNVLKALAGLVSDACQSSPSAGAPPSIPTKGVKIERSLSDTSTASSSFIVPNWHVPISPASEAFAEVLICEMALKNKGRFKVLWKEVLQNHYLSSLTGILVNPSAESSSVKKKVDPGLEKRVTGLLRLSVCAVQRNDMASEILSAWKYVLPMNEEQHAASPLRVLDRHVGEGLWRIVTNIDGIINLDQGGWEGLVSLLNWCAQRAAMLKPVFSRVNSHSSLPEDDPALQCYRSLHLILHTTELDDKVPCSVVDSLSSLIEAGESREYPQLSIATLDLLNLLHDKKIERLQVSSTSDTATINAFWSNSWRKIVAAMAEAAEKSSDWNVRQHALSMLTDVFMDRHGSLAPIGQLCGALSDICIPLAGRCIVRLQCGDRTVENTDELMIEFELCIGLIFKPLRHHLSKVVASEEEGSLFSIWKSVLSVVEDLLGDEKKEPPSPERRDKLPSDLKAMMHSLAHEHLQNAIMVLISAGVLQSNSKSSGDLTSLTWESVGRMGISEGSVDEWKKVASQAA